MQKWNLISGPLSSVQADEEEGGNCTVIDRSLSELVESVHQSNSLEKETVAHFGSRLVDASKVLYVICSSGGTWRNLHFPVKK